MVQQVTLNRHFLAKKNVQILAKKNVHFAKETKGIHRFCKSGIVPRAVVVSQDQFPVVLVLGRLFCPQSSPYSRISGPGMPFRAAAKTGFPRFRSWHASPAPCQARIPAFPVLAEYSPAEFARILRNLQNPDTAIGLGGAWEADRCERRANILTDLSRSYALYSPGSRISVPALCKSELFRSQPVLARTIFLFDKYGPD